MILIVGYGCRSKLPARFSALPQMGNFSIVGNRSVRYWRMMRSSTSSNTFLPSLHLLRGVCAVGVACYHFMAWQYNVVISSMGTFGVYTFFTLSAVVLLHRHSPEFSESISRSSLLTFYRLRIARVVPLLAAVAIFGMLLAHLKSGVPIADVWSKTFLTASGLMAFHMPGFISTTAGAWSLGIEIAFYIVFPVLALLLAGSSVRFLAALVVMALFAQYALLVSLPETTSPDFWDKYIMPLTFAPFFAFGFLIHAAPRSETRKNFVCAILAVALLFGFSVVIEANVYRAGPAYWLLTSLSAGSVYFALNAKMPAALDRFSHFLGDISYSLYLTHWMAYELIKGRDLGFAAIPVFAISALAISVLAWQIIEKPMRRKLSPRRPHRGPAVTASAHS